jgi:hypothetical protein
VSVTGYHSSALIISMSARESTDGPSNSCLFRVMKVLPGVGSRQVEQVDPLGPEVLVQVGNLEGRLVGGID